MHPRYKVPHRAEFVVGLIVSTLAVTTDLRSVIGFSTFAVLFYYAIANASAWTLDREDLLWPRLFSGVGFIGCLALAFSLPTLAVGIGAAVLAAGAMIYLVWLRDGVVDEG